VLVISVGGARWTRSRRCGEELVGLAFGVRRLRFWMRRREWKPFMPKKRSRSLEPIISSCWVIERLEWVD